MRVQINLLGPFELLIDEEPVSVTRGQVRLLIALLAASQGDWLGAGRLESEIWGDDPPASPRTALQIAVSRTRSALGDDTKELIESGPSGYRLNPAGCICDLFEWLAAAGRSDPGVPNAERAGELIGLWRGVPFSGVPGDSMLLTAMRERLIEQRVDLTIATTRVDSSPVPAVAALRSIARDNPLREDVTVALIDCYRRAGRVIDAIALAREFRERLRDELGLSPTADFDDAEKRLLTNDTVAPAQVDLVEIERHHEREPESRWRDAIVVETADLVVGASTLLVDAPQGYGAQRFVRDLGEELASRGVAMPTVDIVRPSIDVRDDRATSVVAGDELTVRLGRFTLDEVAQLARATAGEKARSGDELLDIALGDAIEALWSWYRGEPDATAIGAELLVGDGANFSESMLGRSLPIAEADRRRWDLTRDRLTEAERELSALLAVAGHRIDHQLVAKVSSRSVDEIVTVVDKLAPELVEFRAGVWVFRTESARAVVSESLSNAERTRAHAAFFGQLGRHSGALGERAIHAIAAHPLVDASEVATCVLEAVQPLIGSGQAGVARLLAARSTGLNPDHDERTRLTVALATATEAEGFPRAADRYYDEAIRSAAASRSPDATLIAEIAIEAMGHRGDIGGNDGRRRRLELARRLVPEKHPRAELVTVELVGELLTAGLRPGSELKADVLRCANGLLSEAQLLARRVVAAMDDIDDTPNLRDARELAADVSLVDTDMQRRVLERCLIVATHIAAQHGELATAESWLTEMEHFGHRFGQPRARWRPLVARSSILECRGRADQADAVAEQALDLGQDLGLVDALPSFLAHHLLRAFRNGSLAVLADSLDETSRRLDYSVIEAFRGLAQLDLGDEMAARAHLDEFRSMIRPQVDPFRVAGFAAGCLLAARLRDEPGARFCFRQLAARTGLLAFVGYCGPFVGPVDWFLSVAAAAVGERSTSKTLESRATGLCERVGLARWKPPPLK